MERLRRFLASSGEALTERDFRLYWIGQTGSAIGDSLVGLALAFAVLAIGGSAGDLGLVFAAFSVPRVVLTLAGGVWADRLPRKRVMVACDLVRAAAQAVMSTLLITGSAQVPHLMGFAVVMGSASAFFTPAAVGLMPQIVSTARVQQANALVSISSSAAHIFGPAVAGFIVLTYGAGWAFAIDGVSFLVSAGFLLAMRVSPHAVPDRRTFVTELAEGWREVVSRTWVLACIVTFSLSNVSLGAFQILGPIVAQRELGGAAAWGIVGAGSAIGGIAGGAISLRWKPSRPLIPAFGVMLLAQIELLLLIPPFPVLVVAAGAFITVAAIVISNTLWDTMIQQHIPRDAISRVSGYDWMFSLVFQPLAFAAVGPLSEGIGIPQTLLLCTAIGLAANSLVLVIPSVRNLRRLDDRQVTEPMADAASAGDPTDPPLATSV